MDVNDDSCIVIGIDFGTTYSGVAWARSGSLDQINIITNWHTQVYGNADKNKTPTEICYNTKENNPSWGYDIMSTESPFRWFKLLLVDEKDLPSRVRRSAYWARAKDSLQRANKHPVEVIRDYLKLLWKHSIENIERALGKTLVGMSRFKIVITLPAIWPAYAQMRMKQAIYDAEMLDDRPAGVTTLSFISEPEAAALATMEDMQHRADIKKNDHFIVCDAGGGTVDIITYKVVKPTPMTVRESVRGDGKLCGAVFLDEGFTRLLRESLPRSTWDRLGEAGVRHIIKEDWENGIKAQFCNDSRPWHVRIPFGGTVANRFHPPEVKFDRQKIFGIFKPVIAEVAELVCSQIDAVKQLHKKAPKYIVLVGGFGKSNFLYQYLQEAVEEKALRIDILQSSGERPWTAVCRGAVIRGLRNASMNPITIDSRIARASYGTVCNIVPWDTDEHDERDKSWCPVQQEFLAVDQTQWFLEIGREVLADEPITLDFFQDLASPEDEIVTELVYSTAAHPPTRCDNSVKHLCKIVWSKIPPFESLPMWKNKKGETFRHICYEIRMKSEGASLDFEIVHQDEIMASRNVEVDFAESGAAARPDDYKYAGYTFGDISIHLELDHVDRDMFAIAV